MYRKKTWVEKNWISSDMKKKKRTYSQMGRKRRSGSVNSWGKQTIYENLKEIRKTQTFLK
jgi:hypothetical protein